MNVKTEYKGGKQSRLFTMSHDGISMKERCVEERKTGTRSESDRAYYYLG